MDSAAIPLPTIICTIAIIAGAWFAYSRLTLPSSKPGGGAYDPQTGIGRGAPGFQTNVRRVALPADLVARIRAGEEISPEEIAAAQEKLATGQAAAPQKPEDEWIPAGLRKKQGNTGGRRKGRK
ncbi:hypothetical protein MVES1_000746 [Malassezia vespertilionis]|uniref:Uncharacterized protein n=1 Tax=Malassezia vespertilionis TaxID=2020962 RepID=A0A2N1JGL7_9BASI|nr:uncharacterized protein MVES1_000746 [Malassezia vespertilionis]PKI85675.1 hypothetical protein MVES_000703 [Malassezia vespertilionis]WFD05416.1 hypothetical protein MVES1_000746 [Malassezia vespertilionis]